MSLKNFHKTLPSKIMMIIGAVILAIVVAFLLGFVVMYLWNWLMPDIFNLPKINYWQSWGLVLLAHIFFKAHPKGFEHKKTVRNKIKNKLQEKCEPTTD